MNTHDYTRKTLNNSRTFVNAGETFSGALPGTGTIVAVHGLPVHRVSVPDDRARGRSTERLRST